MIIDALASARFVSLHDTEILADKIKRLGGQYVRHELHSMIKTTDRVKQDGNEHLHLIIEKIHKAITDSNVIEFTYGKFNMNLEFQLNRNGDTYRLDPYELYWNHDYYYLIGKSEGGWRHFRVDRIVEVLLTNQPFVRDSYFVLSSYISKVSSICTRASFNLLIFAFIIT